MSGSNFARTVQAATLVLALGATVAPPAARAAAKTSTNSTTIMSTTNPYEVVVPKTFGYNTTGGVRSQADPSSIKGPAQLAFSGVSSAVYVTDSNQPIQLGQFTVTPAKTASGAAAVTTYAGTPFVIQVRAPGFDKTSKIALLADALPNFGRAFHLSTHTVNSLLIKGHLDGTVNGSATSSVTATVDSVHLGGLQAPSKSYATNYTFPVRYTDLKLPTSWTMNTANNALATGTGTTTATSAAQLLATPAAEMLTATPLGGPTPTPEPATIVIFAAAIGGFAWSRRRRATCPPPVV